jgi:pyruvate dehydrogenase E2 component (dihydrolipoamide acetyltransferase)
MSAVPRRIAGPGHRRHRLHAHRTPTRSGSGCPAATRARHRRLRPQRHPREAAHFFEVDRHSSCVAALKALADDESRWVRLQPDSPLPKAAAASEAIEVKVPDIGDFADVPVIEVFVKPGDVVKVDDALVTLESDKATMDVPSTVAGTVRSVLVKVGDKVAEGSPVVVIDAAGAPPSPQPAPASGSGSAAPSAAPVGPASAGRPSATAPAPQPRPAEAGPTPTAAPVDEQAFRVAHASPSVRMKARELGVDISKVPGTGPKGRILAEDVRAYVKKVLTGLATPGAPAGGGAISGGGELNLIPWPKVDFAKFGAGRKQAAVADQEDFGRQPRAQLGDDPARHPVRRGGHHRPRSLRVALNKENEAKPRQVKVTMLAFLIKASVAALKKFPELQRLARRRQPRPQAVLPHRLRGGHAERAGRAGAARRRPEGRAADRQGDGRTRRPKAREGKLKTGQMQGGCFTISSLGGIGGTAFTPIINAPEVAILGVSKSATMKPVWDGKAFQPRLMVPLSLSYDHRVIDGAAAARFTAYLAQLLADMRRAML